MPRVGFFQNGKVLDELEASTITPGARELQPIGGGRYIPGRAGLATISIALSPVTYTSVMTAQRSDQFAIVTEDRAIYRLVGWEAVDGNVLEAQLEPLGVAPSPD